MPWRVFYALLMATVFCNPFATVEPDGRLEGDTEDAERLEAEPADSAGYFLERRSTDRVIRTLKIAKEATYLKNDLRNYSDEELGVVHGVLLQADGMATTNSYVDSGNGSLPNLTEVTLCVRFLLLNGGQPATIFSYYDGTAFEQLNVAIKYPTEELLIMCCAYHVHQYIKVPVYLFTWHHLCVALNIRRDTLKIVFDDKLYIKTAKRKESDSSSERAVVKGGGRFVMGQNINLDAEWDVTQSFHGKLADFRLYSQDIPLDEMRAFASCKVGAISFEPVFQFNWTVSKLEVKGQTEEVTENLSDLCHKELSYMFLFPEKMVFDQALQRCQLLKGNLAVPRSEEENARSFDRFVVFNNECTQGWSALYWLGLKSNIVNGTWRYATDDAPVTYENWLEGWSVPSEQYPCATAASINNPYLWYNADCSTLTCPVCNFTSIPKFRLRGLCKESKFDRDYALYGYQNGRPAFEGMFFSRIVWDSNTWVLKSRKDESIEARMVQKRPKGYPLGLATWEVDDDDCPQVQADYLLTLCDKDDFTCSTGSCIEMEKRCDHVTDCADGSDELNCGILRLPLGYSPDLPPPSCGSTPLSLKISIEITSVREFNLVAFSMQLDVIQIITWKDARLTFSNLRPGDFVNQAKVDDEVWRPRVAIQDSSRSPTDVTMRYQVFRVNLESSPLPDDDIRTSEDKLYAGANNSMRIVEQYTVAFMCQYGLQMYPFDTQRCLLSYNVTNMEHNFAFEKGGIVFSGERRLLEYRCVREEMVGSDGELGVVQVILIFRNQYGYYIGNAVVPSLLMVVICYLSFFFDLHDFQDRIMVSLTSLLVLASLFSQTSQSIPKTAYLKLIDVWYVCLITVDFIIIVILVLIDNLSSRASASAAASFDYLGGRKLSRKSSAGVNRPDHRIGVMPLRLMKENHSVEYYLRASRKINSVSLVVFPVACFVFCLIFFVAGFYEFSKYEES